MELSSSNVKKHSYIFSYISENETLHFLGQTLQIEINPPGEKRKRKSRKNFLCFLKRKLFLCFRKTSYNSGSNFSCLKIF